VAQAPCLRIQLALCTEITGLPLCNHTAGTILLTAPFAPPDQTYNVTIPAHQTPGLTALLAGYVATVNVSLSICDLVI
jgi:hypothetical protein